MCFDSSSHEIGAIPYLPLGTRVLQNFSQVPKGTLIPKIHGSDQIILLSYLLFNYKEIFKQCPH